MRQEAWPALLFAAQLHGDPAELARVFGGAVRAWHDRHPVRFASIADWDESAPDTRRYGWVPKPTRPRPELTATRWGGRGVKSDLYRDDPPA
ncbi:hypothetical protein [Catellatospora paridis]|uniref:hypothetical protein n=1 Tax=Catellatospora paridis TaxID=1617086 RepID=UPI0018AF9BF4|nr:hypothetical protein [Catellatospora paridis]